MKKALSILLALTFVVSSSFVAKLPKAEAAENQWNTERYGDTYDIGPKIRARHNDEEARAEMDARLREMAKDYNFNEEEADSENENVDDNFTFNGGTKTFLGLNDFYGGEYLKDYTLRSIGENCEVWVARDLSYPEGDARPAHVVTQEEVDLLRDEFDNKIYPTDTDFFGMPDSHSGENATLNRILGLEDDYYVSDDGVERVMIFIDNIRDDNAYDPEYPNIIAGFFSPSFKGYIDRNIISIDSDRVTRFLDTVAHEFQHLIHNANDPLEETWINEGMSMYAEYLCGYGNSEGHVNTFLDHPENSLVEWDEHVGAPTGPETLADYGQAYLFQLYLNDQYGKELVKALALSENQGIDSVNEVLADFGIEEDFEEVFRRFTIALAIDSPEPGDGIYNFDSIDLSIHYETAKAFEKDGVPAWGADYKVLEDVKKIRNVLFDGIEFMPHPWKVINDSVENRGEVLWGNNGDEKANQIIVKADLTDLTSATLKFDHYYNIEEEWDYGFVQVSVDNGESWISLNNANTRTDIVDEGHPAIGENLPGFTGTNGEWTTEEFDLTSYVGQEILINFNYMTDWGYNEDGWFIDNVQIPEIGFNNDCSSLDGFYTIEQIKEILVDYAVTFINEKSNGNSKERYKVLNIDPFNITEQDMVQLEGYFNNGTNYMVVWYAAPVGSKGSAEFNYEIITQEDFVKNKKASNGNKKSKK